MHVCVCERERDSITNQLYSKKNFFLKKEKEKNPEEDM